MAEEAEAPPARRVITIAPAVEFGGLPYSEIVLREPTVEEMEQVDGRTGVRWTRELTQIVGALPEGVAKKLGIRTLNSCSDYLTLFTDAGLPTAMIS